MFGALRCNKDAQNNLEYVDLSANSSVDARNYTVLACDQCRDRKLKCSGDLYGCQRCQATFNTCTYRSSPTSTDPSNLKHRRSATDPKPSSSLKPPAKRRQTESNSDCRPAAAVVSTTQMDMNPPLSSDLKDGFWTPITLPVFPEHLHDWDDDHANEHEGLDLSLDENLNALLVSEFPELQDSPSYSASTAAVKAGDSVLNDLVMTPPPTANTASASADSSEYRSRRCECIRVLADILERISRDDGSDVDQADRFDDLLVDLRDGVETCKQVLPCNHCSVCTANSMFVVTVIQQLATMSQDLCRHLLTYQQKARTTSTADTPPLSLSAGIYVGKYQVRAAALTFEFVFTILTMHLKDLQRLLGHVHNEIKTGTKACKLLKDAADVVKRAFSDLQKIANGRLAANGLEQRKRKATF